MKIILVPFCFFPDAIGGTEVYVATLAKDLQRAGFDLVVAAPGTAATEYEIDGLRVRRFPMDAAVSDVSDLYGPGDSTAADAFAKILDAEKPDIVHLHAFTRAVSTRLIELCKARHIRTMFTYHTPTVSCQSGTMMLKGREPCDGKLDVVRCTRCTLYGLGVPELLANCLGHIPPGLGARLGQLRLRGKAWTALRMSHLMTQRHASFFSLARGVDHIVAVCDWARDVLIANKIAPNSISVLRHGICVPPARDPSVQSSNDETCDDVRIAFMGRFDSSKGLHVLIEALRALPSLPIRLDVFAFSQSDSNRAYAARIVKLANDDARITFRPPVTSGEVVERLRDYDYLAVPSQWMETGPLVVLEAFAAGIPVIGSAIGGIAELVRNEVDGLLVPSSSVAEWQKVLTRIAADPELAIRLKKAVQSPKPSTEIAAAMAALYKSVLASPERGGDAFAPTDRMVATARA